MTDYLNPIYTERFDTKDADKYDAKLVEVFVHPGATHIFIGPGEYDDEAPAMMLIDSARNLVGALQRAIDMADKFRKENF
jgi:hypothetical protein